MPLTKHGQRVRQSFRRRYGTARGDRVFYATAISRRGGRGKIGGQYIEYAGSRTRRTANRLNHQHR